MLHAIEWLRKQNVACVSLLVDADRPGAKALYQALGFAVDAEEQDGYRMMLEFGDD